MAYGVTYITTQGAILAAKTLQSKTLTFSRFQIGDGTVDEEVSTIKALTDLVNQKLEFAITKIARERDTQVTVRGLFKNTDADEGFWLRELGLYAIDPDTSEEILFAYINYGDEAEYINNSISEKKEHYYDMIITVDNADNITVTIDPSTVYVTEKDLNELKEITVAPNAGAHNAIYRGKNITDLFYDGTLSKQIAAGTFDDIFVGDYIIGKSSGRKYLVADLNYRLHCGDTECTTPHVLMIPELSMYTAQMNSSSITTGAYVGSAMYINNLANAKTIIQNDFTVNHILTHRNHLQNAITDNYESGGSWYDSTIDLMNEMMVYGCMVFKNVINDTNIPNNYQIDNSQLSLFRLDKSKVIAFNDAGSRQTWWLRDVVSSNYFINSRKDGIVCYNEASDFYGVRPAFLIY